MSNGQDAALLRIEQIVNDACDSAAENLLPTSREAINWGDLGCAEVGTKNDAYYVVIEEASPDSYELVRYVYMALVEAGFPDVEVSAEW